jgi:hypothetical protein
MKTILALCGAILLAGGILVYRAMRVPTVYGTFTGAPKAEVADVLARPKDFLHKTIALEDVIRNQCTTMGCYFFFQSDQTLLRVELAEIAMNAPKRRNGRKARVEGQLVPYDHGYQVVATAVEFE